MALDADTLLDRMQLKQQVVRWRTIAIVLLCLALLVAYGRFGTFSPIAGAHIAQVSIEGIITDDTEQLKLLDSLRNDSNVKAVFVRMDTPGGTALGGEELYLALRQISEVKPVVILMRSLCASAGYMAALGGDYILAREGSLTGSIGVIMQTAEFTGLAEKIGVTPITVKSGPNKAVPNPMEKLTSGQRETIESVVDDFYGYFVGLVKERRKLSDAELNSLADGRIFTGSQALEAKLIDGLGSEKEAVNWLVENHKLPRNLDIRDKKVKREEENWFSNLEDRVAQTIFSLKNLQLPLDGLVMIWQPAGQ